MSGSRWADYRKGQRTGLCRWSRRSPGVLHELGDFGEVDDGVEFPGDLLVALYR